VGDQVSVRFGSGLWRFQRLENHFRYILKAERTCGGRVMDEIVAEPPPQVLRYQFNFCHCCSVGDDSVGVPRTGAGFACISSGPDAQNNL